MIRQYQIIVLVLLAKLHTSNFSSCYQGSPWKDFSKSLGNFGKGKSIEDVLRQQMEKQEFYDGDGGKSPPRGGSGGGGGGGSGESGDEGFKGIMEETMQVFLATLGFILLVKLYIPFSLSFPQIVPEIA